MAGVALGSRLDFLLGGAVEDILVLVLDRDLRLENLSWTLDISGILSSQWDLSTVFPLVSMDLTQASLARRSEWTFAASLIILLVVFMIS